MIDGKTIVTILIAFLGWIFLIYLNNRTLKRSEISRQKDILIEKIDSHAEWLTQKLKKKTTSDYRHLSLEDKHTAKAIQIALRVNNLNNLIGADIIEDDYVNFIVGYDLEVYSLSDEKKRAIKDSALMQASYDFIEHIETKYSEHYFSQNMLLRFWKTRKDILAGVFFGLLCVWLLLKTLEIAFS